MTNEPPMYRTPQRWLNIVGVLSWACAVVVSIEQTAWLGFLVLPVCLLLGILACRIIRP